MLLELVELHFDLLINLNKEDSVIHKQIDEADEINKKSSLMVRPPLSFTSTLSYMTHPQAVYTSRLLDFKNLPEPKNADNNDDLLGIKYSDSLRIDFTKLDINSKGNEWGDENDSGWDEEFSLLNEPYKKRKFRICPEKYGKCPEIFCASRKHLEMVMFWNIFWMLDSGQILECQENGKKKLLKINLLLNWSDNTHLEKKNGTYLMGKIKKSTYFDKYGPSVSFMKAAKGTIKISTFMNNKPILDGFEAVLDDMDEKNEINLIWVKESKI
ncbi:hypothetical protein RhiirC2_788958 [Rhizophagus irregularis]|uniref:Uncharacterized protein n=1 Tax=Rhizophagus irregularis TaxID=588596 RepID=A0A2N1MP26_9GLOM|nr:hypothetical protein RhiirC2_788958 [Rhizophagus irregularis]